MSKKINKDNLFQWINIGLLIAFGVFIYFNLVLLGFAICFTLMGILAWIAVYFNTETLWMSIGGFDYIMQKLFKKHYKRYSNFTIGIILFLFGIGSIIKLFE